MEAPARIGRYHVLGPIARTVGDVALGLDAMVGELWSDPLSLPADPGEP